MSRYARKKDDPVVPKVKQIQVSDKNRKPKLVAVVLLLALGVTLIAFAVTGFLTTSPGWETIAANATPEESCAGEFVFLYLLGDGGKAANVQQRELTDVYTQATKDAFQIFHEEKVFGHNVAYLNQHPNEVVEVPQALYDAFALLQKYHNRGLYLAPLYREYIGMFLSDGDWNAEAYDPQKNAEQATYFAEVLVFTTDESAVKLELLDNNQVTLKVSAEYLQYAADHGITEFIDFYWMKNAFIVDYLAQQITATGYTTGTISSFDGFSRNLDTTDREYHLNIFDRVGKDVYRAGTLNYKNVRSVVSLRNYPMSDLSVQQYYGWEDGTFTSCHIDPADGISKSAINDLIGYSRDLTCGEILMQMYPLYVADSLDTQALQALPQKGIETVYCRDSAVITSDADITVTELYQKDNVKYTWR